jgi:hypothetical protein
MSDTYVTFWILSLPARTANKRRILYIIAANERESRNPWVVGVDWRNHPKIAKREQNHQVSPLIYSVDELTN